MAAVGETKDDENNEQIIEDFACLDVFESDCTSPSKRPTCDKCKRPQTVCWCPFLPREPLEIKTTVYILQHPFESNLSKTTTHYREKSGRLGQVVVLDRSDEYEVEKKTAFPSLPSDEYEESRCLRTVPILQNSVPADKCYILKGKRFPKSRFPNLTSVLESPNTVLLYPGEDAVDIGDLPTDETYNLVLLDGTWAQAKGIYTQNPCVRALRKVKIRAEQKSKYVIRTQPSDSSLSTLETAAIAIATLERKPEIAEALLHPLVALCDFQLQHGATEHQSREYQMEHGLWNKPISRSKHRQLAKKWAGDQGSPGT